MDSVKKVLTEYIVIWDKNFDDQLAFTIEIVDAFLLSVRGKAIYVEQRIQDDNESYAKLLNIRLLKYISS